MIRRVAVALCLALPACGGFPIPPIPIPTPPPWWTDTQVAPAAVFKRAFKIGQSAMASLPSFIPSVSL